MSRMWPLLVLLLAGMAALGAYLGRRVFWERRWGGYAVLYCAGVAGTATWIQWSGLTQSIRLEAVFGFVLIGVALWGMAFADVLSASGMSLRSRVAFVVFLLMTPPYGVIDWAIDRTEGRVRAEIIGLTVSTTVIFVGMFAVNAWFALHGLPVVSTLHP